MYSNEIINEVLELYPKNYELKFLVENGSKNLFIELSKTLVYTFTIKEIINSNNLEDLKKRAIIMNKRIELFNKVNNITINYLNNKK